MKTLGYWKKSLYLMHNQHSQAWREGADYCHLVVFATFSTTPQMSSGQTHDSLLVGRVAECYANLTQHASPCMWTHKHLYFAWSHSVVLKNSPLYLVLLQWMGIWIIKWANVLKLHNRIQQHNQCILVSLPFRHCSLHSVVPILKHIINLCN